MRLSFLTLLCVCLLLGNQANAAEDKTPAAQAAAPAKPDETQAAGDEVRAAVEAEHDLKQQIDAVVAARGALDDQLIPLYLSLARLYMQTARLDQAEDSIHHAQHISHRKEGVATLGQQEMVQLLFQVELLRGAYLKADAQQKFLHRLREENYAEDTERLIGAFLEQAQWQLESMQFWKAGSTLKKTRQEIVDHFGPKDPRLLPVIRMEAKLKSLQGMCCAWKVLKEAVEISRQQTVAKDVLADNLFSYADGLSSAREYEEAQVAYAEAWSLLPAASGHTEPRLLASFSTLGDSLPQREIYKPDRGPFMYQRLRKLTEEETLFEEEVDPNFFSIPLFDNQYNVQIRDRRNRQQDDPWRELIGEPIQFDYKQLMHLLPIRFQSGTALNDIDLLLQFDVDDKGRAEEVRIVQGKAPVVLERLLREAVGKARFRPALQAGKPVASKGMTLRQTFRRSVVPVAVADTGAAP